MLRMQIEDKPEFVTSFASGASSALLEPIKPVKKSKQGEPVESQNATIANRARTEQTLR